MALINITDEEFENSILKNSGVCLVDFGLNGVDHVNKFHQFLKKLPQKKIML